MSEPINFSDDKSSLNADKLKFPTKNGLLALLGDISEESCLQSILVPRQRFLLAFLSKHSVIIYEKTLLIPLLLFIMHSVFILFFID